MNLSRIEGPATVCYCSACHYEGIGGTEAYQSAATGETRQPEDFYVDENLEGIYCSVCAAKLVQADSTRSVNQFYANTSGTKILPEIFSGS